MAGSRYTLIKGKFWIHYPDKPKQGPEPDGDTVRFEPDDAALVEGLTWFSGRGPNINARGNIAVRYEGIDTLETHFKEAHQNLDRANAARDENLRLLGFTSISYFDDLPNKVESVDANPLEGHVIANGIEANGRLLGLVYRGATTLADGSKPFVDNVLVDQSLNAKLVVTGHAYFEPYDTMPIALIRHLRGVAAQARQSGTGLYAVEDVNISSAASISNLAALKQLVMWPKLFRRLTSYFSEGNSGLSRFDQWVRADPVGRNDTLRLPDGEKANMHDTYSISGNSLRLNFNPEDLLIAPDPSPLHP